MNSGRMWPRATRPDRVSETDWNDWRWQMRHNITEVDVLGQIIDLSDEERAAIEQGMAPLRRFMLANIQADDMQTVAVIGHLEQVDQVEDIPTPAVISAFVLSELKTAFTIAVKVYIPFLVVDIVVASVLLGMGMMVLPPVVISLPFKLLLFVLMDGWGLLVTNMVANLQG